MIERGNERRHAGSNSESYVNSGVSGWVGRWASRPAQAWGYPTGETIVVEFDENGDCSIEGQESVGPACEKALSEIERALGRTTQRTTKPEYM
jgi:hypothetical protein